MKVPTTSNHKVLIFANSNKSTHLEYISHGHHQDSNDGWRCHIWCQENCEVSVPRWIFCTETLTISRTAESHRNNSNNSQARSEMDPEYLEWLEWKRRSAQSAPLPLNRSEPEQAYDFDRPNSSARAYYSGQQQLYLTPAPDKPPSYDYPHDTKSGSSSWTGYQQLEFIPRSGSGSNGTTQRSGVSNSRGGLDVGSLVGQGLNMLQARRGSDQFSKGDFVGKLMNK